MFLIAASVSTLAVSWKDAADRNESVDNAAFVIPNSTRFAVAGRPPALDGLFILLFKGEHIDQFAGEHLRIAAVFDAYLSHHLTDDDLDVLYR